MNRLTVVSHANGTQVAVTELQSLEREARVLRAEYSRDLLTRLAIGLDLQIRRLAHRVAAGVGSGEALSSSRRCNV